MTGGVEGLVLAAGAGRRLRPHTDGLPKTLVALDDGTTVLERILANFSANGLRKATIVVGCFAEAITDRLDDLADGCGMDLDVVHNDHAEDRNNAYSLWCAREVLARGVLLSNGDTLHPPAVQEILLEEAADAAHIRLAIDAAKPLGDEEMKVNVAANGTLTHISKGLPHKSYGEYIGVALIPARAAAALSEALERMWREDVQNYYEAAFQHLAATSTPIETRPIGSVAWIEIDNLDDLRRANQLICRS
jgi:choline kinase